MSRHPEDGQPHKAILSQQDRQAIKQSFADVTDEKAAQTVLEPSEMVRWSDVPLAVVYACDDAEMAVVKSEEGPEICRYQLVSVEDWPGVLTVVRSDGGEVYRATATVGVFADRTERTSRLLEALDQQMKLFSAKRKFE